MIVLAVIFLVSGALMLLPGIGYLVTRNKHKNANANATGAEATLLRMESSKKFRLGVSLVICGAPVLIIGIIMLILA